MNEAWLKNPVWWQEIASRSCILTRRCGKDSDFIRALWNDVDFLHSFHRLARPLPSSKGELERILDHEYAQDIAQSRALHWIIKAPDHEPWGLLSLVDISLQSRRAEVLLGVKAGAPLGLSVAAMLVLFQFYFKVIKFNKLYSLIYADNSHSLKGTLHLGFQREGLLRKHTLDPLRGVYMDVIQTGLLSEDAFSQSNLRLMKRLLAPQHRRA